MDSSPISDKESLQSEDPARPSKTSPSKTWSIPAIKNTLGQDSLRTLNLLINTFGVGESGTGLMALLHDITSDLASLRSVFNVPAWATRLDMLYIDLKSISSIDHVRDLGALRSQPPSVLRTFLTPFDAKTRSRHRAIRAIRGLATMQLLAKKEHLARPLADQLARCLKGKSLRGLVPEHIALDRLREIGRAFPADAPEARLLTFILTALELPLTDPFATSARGPSQWPGKVVNTATLSSAASVSRTETPSPPPVRDQLKGFQVEESLASVKMFSGIPDLYRGLLPFELEAIFTTMSLRADAPEEKLAACLTLLTRVMPQHFDRIPLHADEGAGLWIDIDRGYVEWNLDEILSSHKSAKPFLRSADDRYLLIPLPREIHREMQRRFQQAGNRTLASLFREQTKHLGKSTKGFLRGLSISSHRPTLSRLSDSWARYLLTLCRDEVYASALGIDFTVGTSSNVHYVTLRGNRIRTILGDAYRRLGFTGTLACDEVSDIPSRRLPAHDTVAALVKRSLKTIADIIARFPKRATISRLKADQNKIAIALYAAFKLLTGGRALQEETVTYTGMDLASGLTVLSDKRTAPYHERRVICLPPTLRQWMRTYVGWLRLVAYRIAQEDRPLSEAITATLDAPWEGDRIPFFFGFDGNAIRALGSDDLGPAFDAAGLENNSGRHFVDAIFRDRGVDSAAIMAWMGRGYPGQELFGRWSAVIPLTALTKCANAMESWLTALSLPPAPVIAPRATEGRPSRQEPDRYVPALLQGLPDALTVKMTSMVEPCPYQGQHVLDASLFRRLYQTWRSTAPPAGWPGVALSLVFEDGVLLKEELLGALNEMQQGVVYRHQHQYFVDARTPSYGIRRVWLSAVTIRLLHQIGPQGLGGADPEVIDVVANNLVAQALPGSGKPGIHFIQRCQQAFLFFQLPGLLHAWMRGDSFARVSRPEVIARELFGYCERPSFAQRFSRRERLQFNDFGALHRKAHEALASGLANKTVLAKFDQDLASIQPNHESDSFEWLVVGYARYLCQYQVTLSSVSRYLSACRPFLRLIADNLSDNGWNHIDWMTLALQSLQGDEEGMEKAPDRAAINHCLAWLGVDERIYRRTGPPPSAFTYADRMSEREGKTAIQLLRAKQQTPGDLWQRASAALSLLLFAPLRWDELACLRLGDLCLASGRAHLVVSRESGAKLKSTNAQRVIPLSDDQLVSDLAALYDQRAARFPQDPLVPFFGDDTEVRSHDSLDRVHDLIADALWCASGSGTLRIHDTRAAGLTRKTGILLAPPPGNLAAEPLELRQAMYRIAAQAGHVAPAVTVENYVHGFEGLRRQWQDWILAQLDVHTRPAFAAGVTGVREATYRQRARRSSPAKGGYCWLEGFDATQALDTGATVRDLENLVVSEQSVVSELAEHLIQHELVAVGIYIGLLLLGEPSESARLAAGLPITRASDLEKMFTAHQRWRINVLRAHPQISRDKFISAALEGRLAVAMHAKAPHDIVIRRLMAAVNLVGGPWELLDPEDLLAATEWLAPWNAAGIYPRLELKSLGQSRLDDYWQQHFTDAGFKTRIYPASHFSRGFRAYLKFTCHSTPEKKVSQFRASPDWTYLVTTSLFAIGLLTEESK